MASHKELKESPKLPFLEHYKIMWPFVKPYAFRAFLAIALCIPIGALDAVIALALKPYMDIVLVDKSDRSPAYIPLLIVGFTIVQGALNYVALYMNEWVGSKIKTDVKRALFKKLLSLEPAYCEHNDSGFVIQRFSTDVDSACVGLMDNVRLFVSRICSSIALVGVLIYNSWQLSIIAIVVLTAALLPLARVRKMIKGVVQNTVKETAVIVTHYNETCAGNKTIASYNLQQQIFDKYDSTITKLFKLTIKMVQKTGWMTPMMHVAVSIGVGGVIGYGSYLIVNGNITSGNFVSFITALIMLYTPIKNIGKNFSAVQVSFLAIERIFEILQLKPAISDKKGAAVLRGIKKEIRFDDVCFSYVPGTMVLKHINLAVRAGTTTALVGNSGGGKSTLVNLLPRFYDIDSGSIQIDGKDIRDFSLASLRDNIAVVFQDAPHCHVGDVLHNSLFHCLSCKQAQSPFAVSLGRLRGGKLQNCVFHIAAKARGPGLPCPAFAPKGRVHPECQKAFLDVGKGPVTDTQILAHPRYGPAVFGKFSLVQQEQRPCIASCLARCTAFRHLLQEADLMPFQGNSVLPAHGKLPGIFPACFAE